MKKLLFILLFSFNVKAMSDGTCGSVKSSDWKSPNDQLAKLNGAFCPDRLPHCPYKCQSYYVRMLIDSIKTLIEDLYLDNMIDLETMERQLKALQTERSVEIFKEIFDHIKKLKDE